MAGSKWTDDETIALIDAYGEQIIQDAVDGMATNRVVYCERVSTALYLVPVPRHRAQS